jgi:hypothetical protein
VIEHLTSCGQWIGRGGPVNWPAQYPDLNPLDFGCGGRLKTSAHIDTTTDVEVLQEGVGNGCQEVRVKPLTAAAEAVVGRSPTGQQALAVEHLLTDWASCAEWHTPLKSATPFFF